MKRTLAQRVYMVVAATSLLHVSVLAMFVALIISNGGGGQALDAASTPTLFAIAAVTAAAAALAYLLVRPMTASIDRIRLTLERVADNDIEARAAITSGDEFQEIGDGIDDLVNQRVAAAAEVQAENDQLNDSILALLETVAALSQRDLTIKAKVREDITGPIADALNLMTSETATVLREVVELSGEVAEASNLVKSQSDSVIRLANREREEIERTATELSDATESMAQIARLAQRSSAVADNAIRKTKMAVESVNTTVNSINQIRDTIRQTEKRIKRLGERSQEISSVVKLINSIAERTHILALNASMHAASAGEAGRGFAVVADEVQRLAENARAATSEIATLVSNIQIETANTVTTMNELIQQVVAGSQLAERAGEIMQDTQSTTAELVTMVQRIAAGAVAQAKVSAHLRSRTVVIQESVNKTGEHLLEQSTYTDQLVEHALELVASVGVFRLGEDDALI